MSFWCSHLRRGATPQRRQWKNNSAQTYFYKWVGCWLFMRPAPAITYYKLPGTSILGQFIINGWLILRPNLNSRFWVPITRPNLNSRIFLHWIFISYKSGQVVESQWVKLRMMNNGHHEISWPLALAQSPVPDSWATRFTGFTLNSLAVSHWFLIPFLRWCNPDREFIKIQDQSFAWTIFVLCKSLI